MAESFERRRLRVYVAGPISRGDVWENVMLGLRWGRLLLSSGLAPYIPHLDAYLTLNPGTPPGEDPSAQWNSLLEWDLEWVAASDAVFRIPGASTGADLECRVARELGIPVFNAQYAFATTGDIAYQDLMSFARERGLGGKRIYQPSEEVSA